MIRGALIGLVCLTALPVLAEMRPIPRPDRAAPAQPVAFAPAQTALERRVVAGTALAPVKSPRPVLRGGQPAPAAGGNFAVRVAAALAGRQAASAIARIPSSEDGRVSRSQRPLARPSNLKKAVQRSAAGQSCGRASIQATPIAPIVGRINGCGVRNPVKVTAVSGVRLSQAATINCETAKALDDWVQKGVKPAVGRHGGGATSLRIVSHYACRTRNSRPGARLSEHAVGNAIDVAGIGLANGTEITILTDWKRRREGRMLRVMWRAACGPFGTVLGPEANRFHLDHFHFDVARYRSGPYCK